MTNTEIVSAIVAMVGDLMEFMLPIIGIMSGIIFVVTFLISITLGFGRRTFRG